MIRRFQYPFWPAETNAITALFGQWSEANSERSFTIKTPEETGLRYGLVNAYEDVPGDLPESELIAVATSAREFYSFVNSPSAVRKA
jgi:hypothetical protein